MKSRWSEAEAAQFTGPLGPRVYTSRLLGRDKSLVLHGGGNTSVKLREKDVFGVEHDVLYVKGSGCGPRDHQRGGLRAVAAALPAEAGAPAGAVRCADAERAQHPRPALRRAVAFGRDPAARPPAATSTSTTPTPTRCWRSPTRPTARSASARSTASASRSCPTSWRASSWRRIARANFRSRRTTRRSAWCWCRTASSPSAPRRASPTSA